LRGKRKGLRPELQAFRRDDAGYTGKVVGDGEVAPKRAIEKWLNSGKAVIAEFEDEQSARFQVLCGLGNQYAVKFVAFFAAK
jgi:hypothetical protein